jgi:hypothetical protein
MYLPWKAQYRLLWLLFAQTQRFPKTIASRSPSPPSLIEKSYRALTIFAVVKPFQTRPAILNMKRRRYSVEPSVLYGYAEGQA